MSSLHRAPTMEESSRRVVVRATAAIVHTKGLNDPDWAQNLLVCDIVNKDPQRMAQPIADAVKDVLKTYYHRDSNVVWLCLILCETLVKNCGIPFHAAISNRSFVSVLKKVAGKLIRKPGIRPPPILARAIIKHRVQMKTLSLIQAWGPEHPAELRHYNRLYDDLLKKGVVFPPATPEDRAPYTETERKRRVQMSVAEVKIPSKVQGVMTETKREVAVLESFVDKGDRISDEACEAAKECRKQREGLNATIQRTMEGNGDENDEKVLSAMLLLHERLDRALARYDGEDVPDQSVEPGTDGPSRKASSASRKAEKKLEKSLLDFSTSEEEEDDEDSDDEDDGPPRATKEETTDPVQLGFDLVSFANLDKEGPEKARSLRDSSAIDTSSPEGAGNEDDFLDWLLTGVPSAPSSSASTGSQLWGTTGNGFGGDSGGAADANDFNPFA
jgi:VHS domain